MLLALMSMSRKLTLLTGMDVAEGDVDRHVEDVAGQVAGAMTLALSNDSAVMA